MMIFNRELVMLTVCCVFVTSRTIKSKILTNKNGSKEIIFNKTMDLPQREIDFLIKDLNSMNITVAETTEESTTLSTFSEGSTEIENKTEISKELSENILWKHWNSLTEVGWNRDFRKPVRLLYVNNTGKLPFAPIAMTELKMIDNTGSIENSETSLVKVTMIPKLNQTKFARKIWHDEKKNERREGKDGDEDVTERGEDITEEPSNVFQNAQDLKLSIIKKILDIFQYIFHCVENYALKDSVLQCLMTRIGFIVSPMWKKFAKSINYYFDIFESSSCNHSTNSTDLDNNSQRTFYRQKKFLYTVVLPIVTLMLVKYLLILPFLIFGMFAMKSLLLGLFSVGTATLHSLAKKYEYFYPRFPVKGYRHVEDVDVNNAAYQPSFFSSLGPLATPENERGINIVPSYNKFHI